eukprot:9221010-Pyramimonas_sp.AAC.1
MSGAGWGALGPFRGPPWDRTGSARRRAGAQKARRDPPGDLGCWGSGRAAEDLGARQLVPRGT